MNKKKIFLITGIIAFITLVIGVTYAYFGWQSNEEEQTKITLDVEHVEVIYNGGADITGVSLNPTYTKEEGILKEMTIYVDRSDLEVNPTVTITLLPTILPDELKDESFKYSLLKNEEEVASGNFSTSNINEEILLTNQTITTTMDKYKLYLWIDGNMDNPREMTGKEFSFTLKVSGLHAIYNPTSTKIEAISTTNKIEFDAVTNLIDYFEVEEKYKESSKCYLNNVEYKTTGIQEEGTYELTCKIVNDYGIETSASTELIIEPEEFNYTYSGTSSDTTSGNIRTILLTSSGTFVSTTDITVTVTVQGGGGGGGGACCAQGGNGGNGYDNSITNYQLQADTEYIIEVGAGGNGGHSTQPSEYNYNTPEGTLLGRGGTGGTGGTTTAFGIFAEGGHGGTGGSSLKGPSGYGATCPYGTSGAGGTGVLVKNGGSPAYGSNQSASSGGSGCVRIQFEV